MKIRMNVRNIFLVKNSFICDDGIEIPIACVWDQGRIPSGPGEVNVFGVFALRQMAFMVK